jgi:hypothetical protein
LKVLRTNRDEIIYLKVNFKNLIEELISQRTGKVCWKGVKVMVVFDKIILL